MLRRRSILPRSGGMTGLPHFRRTEGIMTIRTTIRTAIIMTISTATQEPRPDPENPRRMGRICPSLLRRDSRTVKNRATISIGTTFSRIMGIQNNAARFPDGEAVPEKRPFLLGGPFSLLRRDFSGRNMRFLPVFPAHREGFVNFLAGRFTGIVFSCRIKGTPKAEGPSGGRAGAFFGR